MQGTPIPSERRLEEDNLVISRQWARGLSVEREINRMHTWIIPTSSSSSATRTESSSASVLETTSTLRAPPHQSEPKRQLPWKTSLINLEDLE